MGLRVGRKRQAHSQGMPKVWGKEMTDEQIATAAMEAWMVADKQHNYLHPWVGYREGYIAGYAASESQLTSFLNEAARLAESRDREISLLRQDLETLRQLRCRDEELIESLTGELSTRVDVISCGNCAAVEEKLEMAKKALEKYRFISCDPRGISQYSEAAEALARINPAGGGDSA